jgi:hypothetical protein
VGYNELKKQGGIPMTDTVRELINLVEKFAPHQQQRVLDYARHLEESSYLSEDEWLILADESVAELRAIYGENVVFNSVELLREMREERDDDLMGGR